jgi:hypothetical protein
MERARDAIVIRPPSRPDTRPLAKAFGVVSTKADQLVQSAFDVRCSMFDVGRLLLIPSPIFSLPAASVPSVLSKS